MFVLIKINKIFFINCKRKENASFINHEQFSCWCGKIFSVKWFKEMWLRIFYERKKNQFVKVARKNSNCFYKDSARERKKGKYFLLIIISHHVYD